MLGAITINRRRVIGGGAALSLVAFATPPGAKAQTPSTKVSTMFQHLPPAQQPSLRETMVAIPGARLYVRDTGMNLFKINSAGF